MISLHRTLLVALLIAFASERTLPQVNRTPLPENARAGSISAVDTDNRTLSLKPKAGPASLYRVTERTQVYREKRHASLADFKSGEEVVVRFRKSSSPPADLMDLCDRASWDWLAHLRKQTAQGIIIEVSDEELKLKVTSDNSEMEYRVTDKTSWQRAGKPASPGDFKAGDQVFIAPQLLSNGRIKAVAVSDAGADTGKLKERQKPTVSGTVKSFEAASRILHLHTRADDDRDLILAPGCDIRKEGKPASVNLLKPGLSVTAHLKKDDTGERTVVKLTLLVPSSGSSGSVLTPKRPTSTSGNMKKP